MIDEMKRKLALGKYSLFEVTNLIEENYMLYSALEDSTNKLQAAESKLAESEVDINNNDYIDDFSQQVRDSLSLGMNQVFFDTKSCTGVLKEINSLVERVRISEYKLEEMANNKAEPISYEQMIDHEWVKISKARFEQLEGCSWIQKRELYIHPQVQSNADKEIDKPCRIGHMIFREGVKVKTVIEAAQRQYENNPSKEIPADAVYFRNPTPF